jgi:hypothetical protein
MQGDPKATPSRTTTMEVLLDEAIQENQTDSDSAETGVDKGETAFLGQTQDITGLTQSAGIDKTAESCRTSTRNKKTPSIRGNGFFKVNMAHSSENGINMIKLSDSKKLFKIFHPNIRGLKSKVDELSNSLLPHCPSIICLTEYYLRDYEVDNLSIDLFQLGSKFCRHDLKNGGMCVFVCEDFDFFSISLDKYFSEKDIEVCAVRLQRPL